MLHRWTFEEQRRQSGVGHQYRAAVEPGKGGIDESVAANENKPISSLSDAGKPLCACMGLRSGRRQTVRGHAAAGVLRSFRMGRVSARGTGWRSDGDLPCPGLRELRGVSIHPEK
jgi:hypothetical protein